MGAMAEPAGAGGPTRPKSAALVAAALAAALSVVALTAIGVRDGSPGADLGPADRVLVVVMPGLRWQDLDAVETPTIDALLEGTALLSVRAVGVETDVVEGYLTFNSGNTLAPAWDGVEPAQQLVVDGSGCVTGLADAARRGVDPLTGAEVGALGDALRRAGIERAVFGRPEAVAGLMDERGCIDRYGPLDEAELNAGVTLVELSGLDSARNAADRVAIVQSHDRRLATLAVAPGTLVVLAATSAPAGAAEVTVVGTTTAHAGSTESGLLRSATTRRDGYVRSTDLAPTILSALGVAVPSSMNGTSAQVVAMSDGVDSRTADHADLAERVVFRDRAITPVSVVIVVATVLAALGAARGARRIGSLLGSIAVALVVLSFASGLVAYHYLALWAYVALLVAGAALLAVVARVGERATGSTATGWLCALVWLVLVADVATGGALQINTPLGYTPTVAGRFQGIGNLAFGLLATASLVVAVGPGRWSSPVWPARMYRWWIAWVGAVAVVVTALPRLGSDVGGTLASIPAFVVAASIASGRRVRGRRVATAVCAGVAVVAVLGLLDRARPVSARTHLGRFVDRLLDGEAMTIVERKMRANLSLFTASIWPTVLVLAVLVLVGFGWRHREAVAEALRSRPAERAFLGGLATVAVLGSALNDSGVAVAAMMLAVAVPWLVAVFAPRRHGEPG